jgi:chaperone modulatory protein CbpM
MTNTHMLEWVWLDTHESLSANDLCRACGLNLGDLHELVDYGSLVPLSGEGDEQVFSADCVGSLRELSRLRLDLDLDQFTMALVLGYLNRISVLERQLQSIQAKTSAHGDEAHRDVF